MVEIPPKPTQLFYKLSIFISGLILILLTMIEQIKTFNSNALAIAPIDSFNDTDAELVHKFFEEKLAKGAHYVNVLIKLDEVKIDKINTKTFFEHMLWILRHMEHIGNIAVVAHSNIIKALVPLDNFFFERLRKGFQERYFDASQLDEAIAFIESKSEALA